MNALFASTLASTLVLGFAACGGSDLDPGAGDSAGAGTSTLTVSGTVTAVPRLTNATKSEDYDTALTVRVVLNGVEVTTGTVQITSASGTVDLVYNPAGNGQGERRWRGTAVGYDEVYILDVESGPDNVTGVRVDGPDIHTFKAPTLGLTVDSTLALDVTWDRGDTADQAVINTENLDKVPISDTGSYSIAAGGLKADKQQARENRISITRTNRIAPAGAAGGSELAVSVSNNVTVVAMPNPLAGG